MTSPYDAFLGLLEQERYAARKADLDALLRLQEAKREVVQQINPRELAPGLMNDLAEKARANIWLLRHLVQCLQGAVCEDDKATYNAAGERASPPSGFSRGTV